MLGSSRCALPIYHIAPLRKETQRGDIGEKMRLTLHQVLGVTSDKEFLVCGDDGHRNTALRL